MSKLLIGELLNALYAAEESPEVGAIVVTGTATHFSVGADLDEVNELTATDAVLSDWLAEFDRFAAARKPTIAAINGYAVGGGLELALACDLIICADDASLSLPEAGMGVIAGQGGTQRLIQLAGRAIAADMILTGRVISGREAVSLGIAARSYPTSHLINEAVAIAQLICSNSRPSIRFAREVLREASEGHLRQSLRIERLLASLVLDTEERRERVGAFLARKAERQARSD